MEVKLEHYRVFREVARQGGFSAAAGKLFVSQSAVSQTVKHLESQLGVPLFDRRGKRLSLTSEGELLYGYVDAALKTLEQGQQSLREQQNLEQGQLRVGVSDTISRFVILGQLERFHREYPHIRLVIQNGTSIEAVEMLAEHSVDLAFVNSPVRDQRVEEHRFFRVHDAFLAGPCYPLPQRPLAAAEVAALPLILLERKSNARRLVDDWFAAQGLPISPEIELGSHDLLLDFARIGLGVCCAIEEFAEDYLRRGLVVKLPVDFSLPPRHISWCKLRDVSLSPSAKRFVDFIGGRYGW